MLSEDLLASRDDLTSVSAPTSQFPAGLLGLPSRTPSLSWATRSARPGAAQLAYQMQASATPDFSAAVVESAVTEDSGQVGIPAPGGALASRERRFYRVRVLTQYGWSSWSEPLQYEAGLLDPSDWRAIAIGDDSAMGAPSPLLRRDIDLREKPVSARLYISAMGLYDFYVNGVKVGDSFFDPGWTTYQRRLLVETADVAQLLMAGPNALAAELSDGWWRGKFGFMNGTEHYGKDIALIAQLEVQYADGSIDTFATDSTWKCSTGEIRFSSIYDGSTVDFDKAQPGWNKAGFDDSGWNAVTVRDLDPALLWCRITDPVRMVDEFPMTLEPKADRTLLVGEQNIAGWVRLTVDGRRGQTVVVRHAEVLESDGSLHTQALRSARATDTYVLDRDGRHVLEPRFTFHGFQYADVVTDAEVVSAVAVAISSAVRRRGNFTCSDTRLNRLHENVVWSQLDNFVSIPTDCPQRDERLGWTGDAQAFAATANVLFDVECFWRSWLIDLELDQYENGDVGAVVPDLMKFAEAEAGWIFEGRAGWADAATIVPTAVYESYGDVDVLRRQLTSMRRWVDALDARRQGMPLLPTEFQFGDWCDPDAPGDRPWEAKVSADFVANAFFAHSAELLSCAEALVGSPERANHYAAIAQDLKVSVWATFGADAVSTTAGCAIALEFDIAPRVARVEIADHLAAMVTADNGKITTGFLATPLILHALSKSGHADVAYMMLMRRDFRSWLYAVDKGATTMWERWDAITESGDIHTGAMDVNGDGEDEGSMISFNHYAYGAVVDWMYRNIGGLAPVIDEPGYRTTIVAPKPTVGLTFAKTSVETRYGTLALDWSIEASGDLVCSLRVPFGVTAVLDLPTSDLSTLTCNGVVTANGARLSHGTYLLVLSTPALLEYRPLVHQ